ncbi:MAG: hypothetical protein IJV34_00915 [Prevotella sp.]|nr:hypothetical protein [Prevotella sp.]
MKKLVIAAMTLLCGLVAQAQEVMVIEKSDGSTVRMNVNEVTRVIFEQATTTHNGREFIDLGLPSGLKWATCNVGASKPEEYGNYYAWGETTPKSTYSWDNYKWGSSAGWPKVTKYNTDSGIVSKRVRATRNI